MQQQNVRPRARGAAIAVLVGIALLAALPAPALAQDMVHRLAFRAGSDEITFVTIGGEIIEGDGTGTFTQVVTVRAFVNGEVAGAIPGVAVSAPAARRLAHGPAILFLDLCGLLNDVNAVAENFGLTLGNLPPSPIRLDLDRLDPAVRTQVGPYVLAGVAANARAAGAMLPPPASDRRLRLIQIRKGTLTTVPGDPLQRPIVLDFVRFTQVSDGQKELMATARILPFDTAVARAHARLRARLIGAARSRRPTTSSSRRPPSLTATRQRPSIEPTSSASPASGSLAQRRSPGRARDRGGRMEERCPCRH